MDTSRTRSILVTGACGSLGAAVTERLLERGCTVFAVDSNAPGLGRMETRSGVVPLPADTTSSGDLARARATVEAAVDGLDGVVCCAGVFAGGPLVEVPEESLWRAVDVNLMGVFRTVREFFPLLTRRRGTIVTISSESARCAMPFNGPYTVSKCALEAYCDVLRRELMFVGVPVVIVQPGAFGAAFLEQARHVIGDSMPTSRFSAQLRRALRALDQERTRSMDPGAVASVVVRALHARRPRPRYRIGNPPLRVLLGKLPAAWADALIRWYC